MQQVFKQNEYSTFKEFLFNSCIELEDEERDPGSSLRRKASEEWINNNQNCKALWDWFNSDSYEELCEKYYENLNKTVEIPNLGQWTIDFVPESGSCVIINEKQSLEYWLWMVPDRNVF